MTTPECPGYLRMLEKVTKRLIPLSAHFELTYRCNLDCIHCYVVEDESRQEMNFSEVCHALDELAGAGCLFLAFTGGEVLVRPDFWDIASYARQKNFVVRILTNGTLIDKEAIERLSKLSVGVEVSLYGASADVHDRITQIAGSYEATLEAVRRLRERRISVAFKVPVMTENEREVGRILDLAEKFGVGCLFDPIITPRSDGKKDTLNLRIANENLVKLFSDKRLGEGLERSESSSIDLSEEVCAAARRICAVSPYGDVSSCLLLPLRAGNLRKTPFAKIWKSAAILKQIRSLKLASLPQCCVCEALPYCSPCLGLSYLENGDLGGVSSMACRLAHARQQIAEGR